MGIFDFFTKGKKEAPPQDDFSSPVKSPQKARELLKKGTAPFGMEVNGYLDLRSCTEIVRLPEGLRCDVLDLTGCSKLIEIPGTMQVGRLILDKCSSLKPLPSDLKCNELRMHDSHFEEWTEGLNPKFKLDLQGSSRLKKIPPNFKCGTLILENCTELREIGDGLDVNSLDLSNCSNLESLPERGRLRFGRLILRNCSSLKAIPEWVENCSRLDLRGASLISEVPEGTMGGAQIDIAGSSVRSLPADAAFSILWNGVLIDERIAFHPEEISAREIIDCVNVETRRVMLERVGYERFFEELSPTVLDEDQDKGGKRTLLKIGLSGDEDLVCVTFSCPSTGRKYVTRVPPKIKTCHQAVAWMAGFDNPNDYKPMHET